MVEHLTHSSLVELQVGTGEMTETNDTTENEQDWVVSLTMWLKRIVTQFVTVGQIVSASLLFKAVTVGVTRENDLMATIRSRGYFCTTT